MVKPVAGRAYVSIHATLSRFIAGASQSSIEGLNVRFIINLSIFVLLGLIPGITKFSLNLSEILELQFYEVSWVSLEQN